MKSIIFVGTVGCGKTTLSQAMLGEEIRYQKTQSVLVRGQRILDTPGEFLERLDKRGALMTTSVDADVIVLACSAIEGRNMFPPGYSGGFAKECIGVVTKVDLADEDQIKYAEEILRLAGAQRIFRTSGITGEGVKEFLDYLSEENDV
ncbi:MAG: EutP/PduV family microcompartment system protein [Ruminococcaceae bacterium]|nr:EutP/PduV family microcompartment system protein [Oscillospiraceae bacterium]